MKEINSQGTLQPNLFTDVNIFAEKLSIKGLHRSSSTKPEDPFPENVLRSHSLLKSKDRKSKSSIGAPPMVGNGPVFRQALQAARAPERDLHSSRDDDKIQVAMQVENLSDPNNEKRKREGQEK